MARQHGAQGPAVTQQASPAAEPGRWPPGAGPVPRLHSQRSGRACRPRAVLSWAWLPCGCLCESGGSAPLHRWLFVLPTPAICLFVYTPLEGLGLPICCRPHPQHPPDPGPTGPQRAVLSPCPSLSPELQLGAQWSMPGAQYSVLSAWCSVLSAQCSGPGAQCSEPCSQLTRPAHRPHSSFLQ